MDTRILHVRVDPDGTLRLELPLNTPDVELEIVLVFQPRPPTTAHRPRSTLAGSQHLSAHLWHN
ncbi:MAG: hypothetical protein HC911_12980 [Chloroflexaceae bacterium]|nr:hypothetical protein [Chloroflexaceae bacterium]